MNRAILPLALLIVAIPSSFAQYYGEDPVQRQWRESRERAATQQQAMQQQQAIDQQAAQIQRQAFYFEKQRKKQQEQIDDLEYQIRRNAQAPVPASPTGGVRISDIYERLAEFDIRQRQPVETHNPETGWRALVELRLKEERVQAEAERVRAIEAELLAKAEAKAARVRSEASAPADANAPKDDSSVGDRSKALAAEYEQRANASRDRALQRFPSLADRENPWRKKLDAYIEQQLSNPARKADFDSPEWPERILIEFGVRNGLLNADGSIRR